MAEPQSIMLFFVSDVFQLICSIRWRIRGVTYWNTFYGNLNWTSGSSKLIHQPDKLWCSQTIHICIRDAYMSDLCWHMALYQNNDLHLKKVLTHKQIQIYQWTNEGENMLLNTKRIHKFWSGQVLADVFIQSTYSDSLQWRGIEPSFGAANRCSTTTFYSLSQRSSQHTQAFRVET